MDINQAWKNTCRVLFGEEIGDIERYFGYLEKYVEPVVAKKSSISGKSVHFSTDDYQAGAKFISHDEQGLYPEKLAKFRLVHRLPLLPQHRELP